MEHEKIIMEAIERIKQAYDNWSPDIALGMLLEDIGVYDDIITRIQVFEKIAYRKKLPWLSVDLCYQYLLWKNHGREAAFLEGGLKYWRFIGFNDQVEMEIPSREEFREVFAQTCLRDGWIYRSPKIIGCKNGKYRINDGPCIYESVYMAMLSSMHWMKRIKQRTCLHQCK